MSDVEGFENDVLAANGYGVGMSSVKAKRSWDMDRWPAFLRLCGIVNDREIAPGLRAGETDFPLSCGRWEYEMSGEKLFGPSCLGARVNRVAGRAVITNRTIPVYPKRVQWRVCHGWCRDPRVAYPTCLATSLDRNPMYQLILCNVWYIYINFSKLYCFILLVLSDTCSITIWTTTTCFVCASTISTRCSALAEPLTASFQGIETNLWEITPTQLLLKVTKTSYQMT